MRGPLADDRATRATPSQEVDVCLTVAALHTRCGELPQAAALVAHALVGAPNDPRLLRLGAYLAAELGEVDEALVRLERLATLEPTSRGRDIIEARALMRAGRLAEAQALFRRGAKGGATASEGSS